MVGALVVGLTVVAVISRPSETPVAGPPPEQEVEPAEVSPGSAAPPLQDRLPPDRIGPGVDPVRAWADEVATGVDVPARALVAYVHADLSMRTHQPKCRISWATLAGLGRIESDHGRYGGALLREDGRPSRPIIGIPLDGGPGVRVIVDSDGGVLDGDRAYDRAVGPLQFIPSTWRRWAADGNGDGLGDPQNLDDVAVSAARYLCSGGRDMATGRGWWSGVMSYNNSVEYGQKVFALAEKYAEAGNQRR
jgi:membrane-bound lytic murein transglycosylase B